MDTENRVNFAQKIEDLYGAGFSLTELAARLGTTQANLSNMKRNSEQEPRYSLGARIIELHRREMVKIRERRRYKNKRDAARNNAR